MGVRRGSSPHRREAEDTRGRGGGELAGNRREQGDAGAHLDRDGRGHRLHLAPPLLGSVDRQAAR